MPEASPAGFGLVSVCEHEIIGPPAWTRRALGPGAGRVSLSAECLAEIDAAVTLLRGNPLPTLALAPRDFELPACRAAMTAVKRTLDEGVGFALLDRLPLDRLSREDAVRVYWLLAGLLARPVAQRSGPAASSR